ncbi:MAG TPA: S9 family peptidase, partial [Candidatus Marinimicrobia bacterium]|nr:S9 family peptidase [Candidatus Neomarinimicrobiota bacterium]
MKSKLFFLGLIFFFGVIMVYANPERALTFDDLIACQRLKDPQFSPDGSRIAFAVQTMNEAENKSRTDIFLISPERQDLRQLTDGENSGSSPRWASDGRLAFLSSNQIWIQGVVDSVPKQLTNHYSGVAEFVWSPDGKYIAFASRVYPDCPNQECLKKRDEAQDSSKVKARVYDELLYRHWDEWWDHKRSHIFVLNVESGEFKDVTPGDFDAPPLALSSGFTFSPDSRDLVFTSNHAKLVAASTDNDVWMTPVEGGALELISTKCRDRDFDGNDSDPRFSPNGKYLAFLSMKRAGFESDKPDLFIKDMKRGKFKNLTADLDIRINSYQWMPDGKSILLQVDEEGRYPIKRLDIKTGKLTTLVRDGYNKSISISPDGNTFVYLHERTSMPFELYIGSTETGESQQLTYFNKDLLADVAMNDIEDFWFEGAEGAKVHGFIVK